MVFKSNKESRKESLRARWDCTPWERFERWEMAAPENRRPCS